jgi:plastocyanin
MLRSLVLSACLLLALAAAGVGRAKEAFDLKGEVYATGFKIEMQTSAGRTLKVVKAGTYRIKVEDRSAIHDFHLIGPGVNKSTGVHARVETIWTVRLRPGTYRFVCDPHKAMMRGSFRVTA